MTNPRAIVMTRLAPALLLLVAGCAQDTRSYPSLAVRPAESAGFAEPDAAPAVATPDPALDTGIATLRTRLSELARGYGTALASAERLAAGAGARTVGSEAWLSAQSALAELDDWRAQTTALASEVDALAVTRASSGQPPYPALAALADTLRQEQERQTTEIARLQQLLPAA
jgi:hypothetical protein